MRTRGFALETWAEDGLRYAAISDLDPRDLQRFATLVRER
jgi:anti-sigma factor RsiW